jgi:GNAT superfamily N-acetyltransferase
MAASAYALEPVEALGAEAASAVRQIYTEGFPHQLRAPFHQLTEQRQPGERALALVRSGQPAGFAVLRPLGDTSWTYLRYFVVDLWLRGQGVGGVLWDQLSEMLRDGGCTLVVFDVEDPAEPGCPPAETHVRSRRIGFYQRHGARMLPIKGYCAPHPAEDDPGWAPLLLMAAATQASQQAPGDELATAIVSAVYRHRWQLEPDDPRIASVQAGSAAVSAWTQE